MKKLLLFALLIALSLPSFAQDSPGESSRYAYCQVVGTAKFLSTKVRIDLDFGEERKHYGDQRVRDPETGKQKDFNSMIDALNYMGKQGWEFEQAYVITVGNQNIYHYIMKKSFGAMSDEEREEYAKN